MSNENLNNEARIGLSLLNAGLGMNKKSVDAFFKDKVVFGIAFLEIGYRKWWNPMRWIKGALYQKRIQPKDLYA